MVVIKSKSHPDLLFYGRGGKPIAAESCGDSVSSLEVVSPVKDEENASEVTRSVIGGLLWKLLLNRELSVQANQVDWEDVRKKHGETLSNVSIEELQRYHRALTSIVILDDAIDDRASGFLKEYNAKLVEVSSTITQELKQQSPHTFTAFVADFNDNLAYCLKPTRDFPASPRPDSQVPQEKWNSELEHLASELQSTLQSPAPLEIQGSFLKTEYKTIPQPAHVDFTWPVLEEQGQDLWLAFFSLTQEGMILQVWPRADDCQGQLVFCPLGKMLITPSSVIHGGGFRTKPVFDRQDVGNLRYHLYLAIPPKGQLPRFANNTYTLPNDKRYELADVCVNAPHLVEADGDGDALLTELLLD